MPCTQCVVSSPHNILAYTHCMPGTALGARRYICHPDTNLPSWAQSPCHSATATAPRKGSVRHRQRRGAPQGGPPIQAQTLCHLFMGDPRQGVQALLALGSWKICQLPVPGSVLRGDWYCLHTTACALGGQLRRMFGVLLPHVPCLPGPKAEWGCHSWGWREVCVQSLLSRAVNQVPGMGRELEWRSDLGHTQGLSIVLLPFRRQD